MRTLDEIGSQRLDVFDPRALLHLSRYDELERLETAMSLMQAGVRDVGGRPSRCRFKGMHLRARGLFHITFRLRWEDMNPVRIRQAKRSIRELVGSFMDDHLVSFRNAREDSITVVLAPRWFPKLDLRRRKSIIALYRYRLIEQGVFI